jgi:CubicO group peptidase (beta-lactamase class C family)
MKISIKITFLLAFLCALMPQMGLTQQPFPQEKLKKVMEDLRQSYKIPNLTVGVTYKDSSTISNFIDGEKGTTDDVFLIGSNTKSFTALSILQLADSGLVDIDAPVKKYLPWFTFKNETLEKSIKVRHLLNQTSGLPQTGGFFDILTSDIAVFEKGLNAHIQTLTPANAVDANFQYCNLNYTLLGLIVQKVSGMSYKDYVQSHIFKPIGMNHSFANYKSAVANGLIQGHQYAFFKTFALKTPEYSDFKVPEGYIASTAGDMLLYLGAALKNTWGLKEKTYKDWITPYKDGYAMGWGETHYFGQPIVQHLGLNETFNAALFFMPKQEYGVVVLGNASSGEFSAAAKEALILTLLDKPYTPKPNMENIQRWIVLSVLILTFLGFLIHFFKWKKIKFQTQTPKIGRSIVSLIGIVLSILPLIYVPKMTGIGIFDMSKYSPDFAYSFMAIALFGISWALMALFRKRGYPLSI